MAKRGKDKDEDKVAKMFRYEETESISKIEPAKEKTAITPENQEEELIQEIKVAFMKADYCIRYQKMSPAAIWSVFLEGLALKCGGHGGLIRRLLAQDHKKEDIFSWYLSAKLLSKDIFKWFEEAGLTDNESVQALILCTPFIDPDYVCLDDAEIIGYILANGWPQPRQMAAMIANDVISTKSIQDLVVYQGSDWIVEMIGRCGRFSAKALKAILSVTVAGKEHTRVQEWSKLKIWLRWDKLGLNDQKKCDLFLQALDVEELIAFLKLVNMADERIIDALSALKISLGRLADAYAPFLVLKVSNSRQLDPQFVEILVKRGLSDRQIVLELSGAEFTYCMIATGLLGAGWEIDRAVTAMIEAGCNPALISRMVDSAASDFLREINLLWKPEIASAWRDSLRKIMENNARAMIFG